MRRKDEMLLREYVRVLLAEDEAGGNPAFGPGGDLVPGMIGPYGISFGDKNQLLKTFIGPFLDVANTAIGKTKELSVRAKNLVKVSLAAIATTLIPQLQVNYKSWFDQEEKEVERIKSEYREVYAKTDEALRSNDAAFLAFMAYPGPVLGTKLALMTPAAAKETLSVMTGGVSDTVGSYARGGAKELIDMLFATGTKKPTRFREADNDDEKDVIVNKKILSKVLSVEPAKEMQERAQEIYKSTLKQVLEDAQEILEKTKTVDDIEKFLKKSKKPIEQKTKEAIETIKKTTGQERQNSEMTLIDNLQKSFKEYYVTNLKNHLKGVIDAGIPKNHPYVQDYESVISKINSM